MCPRKNKEYMLYGFLEENRTKEKNNGYTV